MSPDNYSAIFQNFDDCCGGETSNEFCYQATPKLWGFPFKSISPLKFVTIFILFGVAFVNIKPLLQSKTKNGKKVVNRILPYVKWAPVRLPFVDGILTLILLRRGGVKLLENLLTHYRPAFQIDVGIVNVVAHFDPSVVQKLLSSSCPGHLNKPGALYRLIFTELMSDGLVVADANVWIHHRKALAPAFTYKAFPTYLKIMEDAAKDLEKWTCAEAVKSNNVLENKTVKKFIDDTAVAIITNIMLGSEDFNIPASARVQFHADVKTFQDLTIERFLKPWLALKPVWMLHPNKRKMDNAIHSIQKFANNIINKYREKISSDINANVKNSSHEDLGIKPFECLAEEMIKSGLSNKEIVDEVCTFLIAGHETVCTAIGYLIFHLAKNPEIQVKCQEEVDNFLAQKPSNEPLTMDDLTQLKYLERCVFESLRITPTIPFFLRTLQTPVELDDGSVIEAGRSFVVAPWFIHRNVDTYPDPEKFDPERFLPEVVKQRHPYAYIPFSMGQRNCIGWKVALLEIKIVTMSLLRHFSFTSDDNLYDAKLKFEVTLNPDRIYDIKFHRRENFEM